MYRLSLMCVFLAVFVVGCSKSKDTRPKPTAESAKATVQNIIDAYARRDFSAVANQSDHPSAGVWITVVSAASEFQDANDKLCAIVRERIGYDEAFVLDQAYVLNEQDLGLFSDDVEVLDAKVDGDNATVSYTVDGKLPAKLVDLKWHSNQWRLVVSSKCNAQLANTLDGMKRALNKVYAAIVDGEIDTEACKADLTAFIETVSKTLDADLRMLRQEQQNQKVRAE